MPPIVRDKEEEGKEDKEEGEEEDKGEIGGSIEYLYFYRRSTIALPSL